MDLILRRMKSADLDEVAALEAAAFSRPWMRSDFEKSLGMEERIYCVACAGERVVAVAGLICSVPEAELMNVSVDTKFRKQGIAERLLRFLFEQGEGAGVTDIVLEVRKNNIPAIGLYEKLGFRQEGLIKNCYTDPVEDGLVYWLRKDS
jgi:ribosomal-protein-alanine N-acetyltransferase